MESRSLWLWFPLFVEIIDVIVHILNYWVSFRVVWVAWQDWEYTEFPHALWEDTGPSLIINIPQHNAAFVKSHGALLTIITPNSQFTLASSLGVMHARCFLQVCAGVSLLSECRAEWFPSPKHVLCSSCATLLPLNTANRHHQCKPGHLLMVDCLSSCPFCKVTWVGSYYGCPDGFFHSVCLWGSACLDTSLACAK